MLYHRDHGFMKVQAITVEEEKGADGQTKRKVMLAECFTYKAGVKTDLMVMLLRDDEELLSGLVNSVDVEAKVHLNSGETFDTSVTVVLNKDLTIA